MDLIPLAFIGLLFAASIAAVTLFSRLEERP